MRISRLVLICGLAGFFWLSGVIVASPASAGDQTDQSPGILERIGKTAKKVGDKIEQGFTKAGRKLKEKKVGEKIEQKLNKAAHKTAEGLKKAGDKINQKLND